MLRAVNTHKLSIVRNFANVWKDAPQALSSGDTFYLGEVEVARLYDYLSGPSQIEVGGELFLLKRQKRVVLFTQYHTLERDGRTLATAKEKILLFGSNSRISYTVERHPRELTLKNNVWSLRGRQYLLLDGQDRVGVIEHNSDFGADIDLPLEIPLVVQIFIYKLAYIMWQRGTG
jgi:hypothetical protein